MSIPGNGNTEQVHRQESMTFSSVIPLKKRRFPVFQPCSPPREEKDLALEDLKSKNKEVSNLNSKNSEEFNVQAGSKNKKESNVQDGMASSSDAKNTDGASQHQLSRGKMNVELSLGSKESPVAPALVHDAVVRKSEKLESVLSLALEEEILVSRDEKQYSGMEAVSNPISSNRSNWDLNTTMDAWEGSNCSDNICGMNKTESCQDDKSLLTVDNAAHLSFMKGQRMLDGHALSSSKLSTEHCKMDDCLGLKLAMSYVDTSGTPNLSSKQVRLPVVNVSWNVKLEPVDDNSKRDCSIGSCSSSNMESSKLTVVKRERVNNHSLETIKSAVVQEGKEETCKSKEVAALSVAKVMQHQECSASSSANAMAISLLPRSSSSSRLPPCSEITTSGDFANQSEQSLHSKESDEPTAIPVKGDTNQLRLCKLGISSVAGQDTFELARIEHNVESYQNADVVGNVEEKMETINEMLEESFGSDTKSRVKEDEEYEDGEIRDHAAQLAVGNAGEKITMTDEMLEQESVSSDAAYPQNCAVYTVCEDYSLQESYEVSKVVTDEKRATSVIPDEKFDMSEDGIHESPREELTCDIQTDGNHGIGIEISGEGTAEIVQETWGGEDSLTLPKVEDCLEGQDADKDFNNPSNKSRIIKLYRPSVLAASFKTKSTSNRLVTSRTGKERYSEFDGEVQPRRNRDEFYGGGSNKFVKDQSVRNSKPAFMRGKGRGSGRFGSSRGEWNSNHNFASESSYGQSDYNSFGGNGRKTMNSEFHSLRRGYLRRASFGRERDGSPMRGFQMLHRISRNTSPRRCTGELDNNQIVRGNKNFSTTLQRKGYPRVRSRTRSPSAWSSPRRRSPDGLPEHSQNRSPTLYMIGRIRSHDLNACLHDDIVPRRHGSPSFIARHSNELRVVDSRREHIHPRSADTTNRGEERGCFFARGGADALDFREMGEGDEYLNGPSRSNKYHELHSDGNIDNRRNFIDRRGPQRLFRPNYDNGNDNFHFHSNDGPRPYRFCRDVDTDFIERSNAQERECIERSNAQEREFVKRSNAQESEYDKRLKHQSVVSRRIRNIEEDEENYRPVETVWHDDGFIDNRVKRRRF